MLTVSNTVLAVRSTANTNLHMQNSPLWAVLMQSKVVPLDCFRGLLNRCFGMHFNQIQAPNASGLRLRAQPKDTRPCLYTRAQFGLTT